MKYFYKYFTARVVLLTLAMLLSSPLIAWAQGTITIFKEHKIEVAMV